MNRDKLITTWFILPIKTVFTLWSIKIYTLWELLILWLTPNNIWTKLNILELYEFWFIEMSQVVGHKKLVYGDISALI